MHAPTLHAASKGRKVVCSIQLWRMHTCWGQAGQHSTHQGSQLCAWLKAAARTTPSVCCCSAYLPGSSFAMLAHLLPKMLCAAMIAASSSGVKGPFLTSGLSWLSHLQDTA